MMWLSLFLFLLFHTLIRVPANVVRSDCLMLLQITDGPTHRAGVEVEGVRLVEFNARVTYQAKLVRTKYLKQRG